jgi:hypothetical protein
MSGPVPKRQAERRRVNKPDVPIVTASSGKGWTWPDPDPSWHPIARDTYVALGTAGQAQFYETSDAQVARFVCELMSKTLLSPRPSGQMAAVILQGLGELLATEGSRRRARIELERGIPEEDPAKPIMARYHLIAGGMGNVRTS